MPYQKKKTQTELLKLNVRVFNTLNIAKYEYLESENFYLGFTQLDHQNN